VKTLIAIAIALSVFAEPAKAQDWTPENFAFTVALMVGYDTNCGGPAT
jgi:hypothetical protein